MESAKTKRVLAVASGGGHWIQLLRMASAFSGSDVAFVTTLASYRGSIQGSRFYVVRDANRASKIRLILMAMHVLWILIRERPDVVISTGAAPGYVAVRLAKLLGASTIWVDSMANAERLSRSGEKIGPHADLWLTQWPHLARPDGPFYAGSVL